MKIRLGKPGRKNRANDVHIDNFDVWSLDHTLSCIIHPALIRLKETKHGYPELFEDGMVTPHHWDRQLHFDFIDEEVETEYLIKKWNDILDKMIRAFGLIIHKEDHEDAAYQSEKSYAVYMKEYYDTVDEGLSLFAKYYHNLWD